MIQDKFGREKEFTTLNINVPPAPGIRPLAGWPNIFGGAMAYIVGVGGSPFATTVPMDLTGQTTATVSITIPNGLYMLYVLAWDGNGIAGYPLAGQAGCGYTDDGAHIFSGGTKDVNIFVSQEACTFGSASVFSDAGVGYFNTSGNFGSLQVNACNGITGISCSAASTSYISGSVRVRLEGYIRNSESSTTIRPDLGLLANCSNFTSGSANTNLPIPVGSSVSADKFIAVTLDLFTSSGCSGVPSKTIHFPKGIVNGTSDAGHGINQSTDLYILSVDLGS